MPTHPGARKATKAAAAPKPAPTKRVASPAGITRRRGESSDAHWLRLMGQGLTSEEAQRITEQSDRSLNRKLARMNVTGGPPERPASTQRIPSPSGGKGVSLKRSGPASQKAGSGSKPVGGPPIVRSSSGSFELRGAMRRDRRGRFA